MNLANPGHRLTAMMVIVPLCFLGLVAFGWVGFIGSDDTTYAVGAYGWIEHFPFVGGHGTIRYTITVPMALSFLAFGENEISMALPTILYAAGLVLLFVYTTYRVIGVAGAATVAIILITNPILVVWSSIASVDIIEAFFVFASVFLFHRATAWGGSWPRLLAAGALAGLGFLTRETAAFLLLFYGLLFLAGYGVARLRYFIMALGFLAVWLAEVLYLTLMTGDPLYRINIALQHDSSIDRGIDLAGNFILHPLLDPFLVVLFNQEFVLLFWIAIPAGLWLLTQKNLPENLRSYFVLLGGLALFWFLAAGAVQNLLPLNPRYFLVSALGASAVVGVAFYLLMQSSRIHTGIVVVALLVGGNLAGIYVENRNYMFGERSLAVVAARNEEPIYTDPMTHHRAELLLRWNGTADRIFSKAPPEGSLYLYNPQRATRPNRLMSLDSVPVYQPQSGWKLVEMIKPNSKLAISVVRLLGLETALPAKVTNALGEGHPGVRLYRLPPNPAPRS